MFERTPDGHVGILVRADVKCTTDMATQVERQAYAAEDKRMWNVAVAYGVFQCVLSVAAVVMKDYNHVFVALGMTEAFVEEVRSVLVVVLFAAMIAVTFGGLTAAAIEILVFRSHPSKRRLVNQIGFWLVGLIFAFVCAAFQYGRLMSHYCPVEKNVLT